MAPMASRKRTFCGRAADVAPDRGYFRPQNTFLKPAVRWSKRDSNPLSPQEGRRFDAVHILEGKMPETSKSNFDEGLREDKPAVEVRRPVLHPKSGAQSCTVTAKKPVARSQGVPAKL
jgi:hypothetical protein